MQALTSFTGTPDDLKAMLLEVVTPLTERIRELEVLAGSRKHAYTLEEVGEMIGYSAYVVREFVREGRKTKKGKVVQLPVKEISKGQYRVLPADLDNWLSNF